MLNTKHNGNAETHDWYQQFDKGNYFYDDYDDDDGGGDGGVGGVDGDAGTLFYVREQTEMQELEKRKLRNICLTGTEFRLFLYCK